MLLLFTVSFYNNYKTITWSIPSEKPDLKHVRSKILGKASRFAADDSAPNENLCTGVPI